MGIKISKYNWIDWTMLGIALFAYIIAIFRSVKELHFFVIWCVILVLIKNIRITKKETNE